MKIIRTIKELKSGFRIEALEPFGMKITAVRAGEKVNQLDIELVLRILHAEKLLLFRHFAPLEKEELVHYCASHPDREVLHWESGPVVEMKEDGKAIHYRFTNERVPFHWDAALHRVPSYLALHCLRAPAARSGGATLFCNTEKMWERASATERKFWSGIELNYEPAKMAHHAGTIGGLLVQKHPVSAHPILRFTEPVETRINPVSSKIRGVCERKKGIFLRNLQQKVYDPSVCYTHQWDDGDFLIADNYSLIHGRKAFVSDTPRHWRRIQIL